MQAILAGMMLIGIGAFIIGAAALLDNATRPHR